MAKLDSVSVGVNSNILRGVVIWVGGAITYAVVTEFVFFRGIEPWLGPSADWSTVPLLMLPAASFVLGVTVGKWSIVLYPVTTVVMTIFDFGTFAGVDAGWILMTCAVPSVIAIGAGVTLRRLAALHRRSD